MLIVLNYNLILYYQQFNLKKKPDTNQQVYSKAVFSNF